MNEKQSKFLNSLIQMELEQGMTRYLVGHLKLGNAAFINQDTWDKLAKWIEGGCKRPRKRPPTGKNPEIKGRNREIRRKYRQKRENHTNQLTAIGELDQEYPMIGRERIMDITKGKK